MIHLEGIEKHYHLANERVKVLHDIHLHIQEGEFTSIMGPSGSGKSTMMNIIGCLDRPSKGQYWLQNQLISDLGDKELAYVRNRSIGFVFQQFQLLPRLNAMENVALPMIYAGAQKKERNKRAAEASKKWGLENRMKHLPTELSGGQKQRVAIARAVANQPQIILADEPTGALDSKTSEQIMDLFSMLHQEGTTIILVSHENEVASYASRTIRVKDGAIKDEHREVKEGPL